MPPRNRIAVYREQLGSVSLTFVYGVVLSNCPPQYDLHVRSRDKRCRVGNRITKSLRMTGGNSRPEAAKRRLAVEGLFLRPDSYKISQSSGKIGQLFGIVE